MKNPALRLARDSFPIALLTLSSLVGCSWGRFDDIKDNVPVVRVNNSSGVTGFGSYLHAYREGSSHRLTVLGQANSLSDGRASFYSFDSEGSSSGSVGSFVCNDCLFGATPTASVSWASDDLQGPCVFYGVGRIEGEVGVVGGCRQDKSVVLGVPDFTDGTFQSPRELIESSLSDARKALLIDADFRLASASASPILLAASNVVHSAWFYNNSKSPIPLVQLDTSADTNEQPSVLGDSFGAAVAVVELAAGDKLFAISSPSGAGADASGRVWLYRWNLQGFVHDGADPSVPAPWGCLSGLQPNFGMYLHSLNVVGDASEELVVSDGKSLTVFDLNRLGDHAPSCGGPALSDTGFVAKVACGETSVVTGCSEIHSEFGRAVAAGDLDGDGTNELLVGAESLSVDGERAAGAVLIYRVSDTAVELLEARYLSSASAHHALGASVSALHVGGRDIIAAGAPGDGAFYVFFCSTIGGASASSSRCQ